VTDYEFCTVLDRARHNAFGSEAPKTEVAGSDARSPRYAVDCAAAVGGAAATSDYGSFRANEIVEREFLAAVNAAPAKEPHASTNLFAFEIGIATVVDPLGS
jgi:hypothetical protein